MLTYFDLLNESLRGIIYSAALRMKLVGAKIIPINWRSKAHKHFTSYWINVYITWDDQVFLSFINKFAFVLLSDSKVPLTSFHPVLFSQKQIQINESEVMKNLH